MIKVYIVETPRRKEHAGKLVPVRDVSDAARFGDIVYLLPAPAPSSDVPMDPAPILKQLQAGLAGFTESDYLVVGMGHPVIAAWAVAIAAMTSKGRLRLLHWDGYDRLYREVSADTHACREMERAA